MNYVICPIIVYRLSKCDGPLCGKVAGSLHSFIKYCCGAKLIGDKREFEKMVRKILLIFALIVVLFSLVSCQAVAGLGRDITWTAEEAGNLLDGP